MDTTRSDAALNRLLSLHPKLVDLSLDRMARLLAALGHPENDLLPVVHVTGTNGKGSVLAFLRAMLEAAGYRVHVYTSPHLVRFHERIRVAGEVISEQELDTVLQICEDANAGAPITFFEITTAAAFVAFTRSPADIVLLENGLGGRLDATNMVARPLLTAITPVSLDHQNFLGDSIEKIAFEKAGIIKPGVPCVLGPQSVAAEGVIRDRAAEVGAPLVRYGTDWRFSALPDGGSELADGASSLILPAPNLPGAHQIANAATAAMMAKRLRGFEIGQADIDHGVRNAEWPARLQRLRTGPLVDALPADWELWLDGGHNPDAGRALAAFIADTWRDRPLYLVCGMIDSKDPAGYFAPMAPLGAATTCITIPGEKAAIPADMLAAAAASAGHQAHIAASSMAAVAGHATRAGPARVLICGSLYLAGRILAQNQ